MPTKNFCGFYFLATSYLNNKEASFTRQLFFFFLRAPANQFLINYRRSERERSVCP